MPKTPPGCTILYVEIFPPESPRLANVRLAVPGWSRHVHHVAMLDRRGDLLLAPDDAMLWRKLREKMSCPTLEQWGELLIKEIHLSGMLLECEAFGVPEELRTFVLTDNAQEVLTALCRIRGRVGYRPPPKPLLI